MIIALKRLFNFFHLQNHFLHNRFLFHLDLLVIFNNSLRSISDSKIQTTTKYFKLLNIWYVNTKNQHASL
jgi:hypothetical protein